VKRAAFRAALAILDGCLRVVPTPAELIRERARSYAGLGDTRQNAADWAEFGRRSRLYNRMPPPLPY
jgi:regulator of sirC expression with transglutaminase-like and TPR domain